MERAIIKDENKTIMLYMDDKSNVYGYVFKEDGSVTIADRSVLSYFNVFNLSKNITVLPENSQYLVVLDNETNLKHYFLHGIEDYEMLFRNNGELALDFSAGDGIEEGKISLSRRFIIKGVTFLLSFSLALGVHLNPVSMAATLNINPLTVDEIIQQIDKSKLSSGDKRQFKQEDLFNFFLPYINKSPEAIKHIEDQLANLERKFLSDEEFASVASKIDTSKYNGFVNRTVPGVINIRKGLPLNVYIDTFSHEAVTLFQSPNLKYNVIGEGMAEQLSFEFFPRTYISNYHKQVEQVRKLADLIGPEPLVECYTIGKTDKIEAKIKPYLGEDGYNDFLNTLVFKRLPKENAGNYRQIKDEEARREEKLDGILSNLSSKMGIKFTDQTAAPNPYYVPHYYFGNETLKMNLLKGLGANLKEAYDKGTIGFARYGDPENKPISYEEAIKLWREQDEGDPQVVVTYDKDGEYSYNWNGAGIYYYDGEYMIGPNVSYVSDYKDAANFCDDTKEPVETLFVSGGLNPNDNIMRYENVQNLTSVAFKNAKEFVIRVDGKTVIATPEEAIIQFADNPEVIGKINDLLNIQLREEKDDFTDKPHFGKLTKQIEKPSSESLFLKDFTKWAERNSVEDIARFKKFYEQFINEVKYDKEYSDGIKEKIKELNANDGYYYFVERTEEDKRATCMGYTFRMQEEAESCGIENYPLFMIRDNIFHWAMLYTYEGDYFVCDPTLDVIYGNMIFSPGEIPPMAYQIPLNEYLSDPSVSNVKVTENFKGNSGKINDIERITVPEFIKNRETFLNRPDLNPPQNNVPDEIKFDGPIL